MSKEKDIADKGLQDYLQGSSELSQLYQSTKDQEPPAALDELILREATNAVKTPAAETDTRKPGLLSRLFSPANGWLVPAASLASFAVVAVLVAVLISSPETGTDEGSDPIATTNDNNNGTQPVSNTDNGKVNIPATAELWLKHIVTLHKAGKTQEAQTNLALFHKKYPKYSSEKLKQALKGTSLVK